MKIAVDASALVTPDNGIGRYLGAMLRSLTRGSDAGSRQWLLYGRGSPREQDWPEAVTTRSDSLPAHLGRILALGSSLPYWLQRDRPAVFWGPAHRLPLWVPRATARVVTIHDLCWLKAPETMRASTRRLDALLMPRALRAADRIIAVSHATASDLCGAFPDVADRVVVVQEAASPMPAPQPIEALARWKIATPYVLFVGTLEPRKNLRRLLQAFARLPSDQRERATLAIVGAPGWGGERVDTEVARLEIGASIRVLGRVDDTELATLYRHATCLAMPSLYEGFGLPLVEAMAQGTPVLTSRTASMPEVAGAAGLLVDPLEVMSIADGLARMLFDQSLRSRLAAEAQQQAARFSWARAAEETLRVFEDAVRERRERIG